MAAKLVRVIAPSRGIGTGRLRELWAYRDLFRFLVWRDLKVLYKQSVLGFGWALLRPVVGMVVLTVVFGRLAKLPSDGLPYPAFSYAGLVAWAYFQGATTTASLSLVSAAAVISKTYFPRVFLPLTAVVSALVDFAIALLLLGGLLLVYRVPPTGELLYVPLIVVVMVLTAAGVGLWLSPLALRYRDVKHAYLALTPLLMFAAPIAWPASLIEGPWRLLYGLYPMAGVIEGLRASFFGRPMPWDLLAVGLVSALLCAGSGTLFFLREERSLADVV